MKIVLQKFIAQSGYCSRRKAEEIIKASVETRLIASHQNMKNIPVLVNGKVPELGMKVDEYDDVFIYGEKIEAAHNKIYIILNKPKGYTCTSRKFEGEKNVFELLNTPHPSPLLGKERGTNEIAKERGTNEIAKERGTNEEKDFRLFVVGRLDKESRGLVLLTNDGDLTQKITHPKYEHEKEYVVTIKDFKLEITNEEILKKIKNGVDIGEGDGVVRVKQINLLNFDKKQFLIKYSIILTEGKKRQIRRMFKALDCHILDLVRVRIGKINLGNLKEGGWRYLTNEEINKLK